MLLAITRAVSRSIVNCELTHLARTPIDVERARSQHTQYEAALRRLGVAVLSLPEEPALANSVFVEDTALVLGECAILLRPGAQSRRTGDQVHRPGTGPLPQAFPHRSAGSSGRRRHPASG